MKTLSLLALAVSLAAGQDDPARDLNPYLRQFVQVLSIVQAQSHDAAAKLFGKTHPHLQMMPGGWIEIVEIMPIPGM